MKRFAIRLGSSSLPITGHTHIVEEWLTHAWKAPSGLAGRLTNCSHQCIRNRVIIRAAFYCDTIIWTVADVSEVQT
jgi:hypothetical protein